MILILAEIEWSSYGIAAVSLAVPGLIAAGMVKSELRHIANAVDNNTAEMKEHRATQQKHGETLADHGARIEGLEKR